MAGTADNARPLAGVRVLVTRPAHQAEGLCRLLESAGATAVRFPMLEIAPPPDSGALERIIDRLEEFDMAIFVSPNAVSRAMTLIQSRRGALPPSLRVACVGDGSASTLVLHGVHDVLVPGARANSEGLLALPALQHVTGHRIVIFRGEGGRQLIAETLAARGAQVEHALCYRRIRPDIDTTALTQAVQQTIDVVTVTSAEALHNLYDMLDASGREALRHMPIVTVSERLQQAGRHLGLRGPLPIAHSTADASIVTALETWRGSQKAL